MEPGLRAAYNAAYARNMYIVDEASVEGSASEDEDVDDESGSMRDFINDRESTNDDYDASYSRALVGSGTARHGKTSRRLTLAETDSEDSDHSPSHRPGACPPPPVKRPRGRPKMHRGPPAETAPKRMGRPPGVPTDPSKPPAGFLDCTSKIDGGPVPGTNPCFIRSKPADGFPGELWEISTTISEGGKDVNMEHVWPRMRVFIDERCEAAMISGERGFHEDNYHLQCVVRLYIDTQNAKAVAQMLNDEIKKCLGWTRPGPGGRPPEAKISCRFLREEGIHTWLGMLGYCNKSQNQEGFRRMTKNVTDTQIAKGDELYIKLGAGDLKGRKGLHSRNVIEKAGHYYKFKLQSNPDVAELPVVLLSMMQSGHFYPSATWCAPMNGGGMDLRRAESLWKCHITPSETTLYDVEQVFFTNNRINQNRYFHGSVPPVTLIAEDTTGDITFVNCDPPPPPEHHVAPFSRFTKNLVEKRGYTLTRD